MCGISGFNRSDKDIITRMAAATTHRGPDFLGTFVDAHISLGHNLLAIRDTEDVSHQPYKESDKWVLLFNGQIYNTGQLKKEHLSPSEQNVDLDTRVLYKLIEKYGWRFIEHIHGMFAIALYNTKEKCIRLYRDPAGQKVLYYYFKDGVFVFGSEIQNILAHDNIDRTIDEEALALAVAIGYIPGERTLLKYIRKLDASQKVEFDLNTKTFKTQYYESKSDEYFEKDLSKAMSALIAEHLQSKQKISINLSGGLDSSLLVHEMSTLDHEIRTYTTHFENASDRYNRDAQLAQRLADDYGVSHVRIPITKESYLANFVESYETIEEPNFNISLPIYYQTAKREGIYSDKNRVILSGDGGDEIFGGYPFFQKSIAMDRWRLVLTPPLFNLIKNKRNHTNFDFGNITNRWLFSRRLPHYYTKDPIDLRDIASQLEKIYTPFRKHYAKNTGSIYELMLHNRILWMAGENFIRSDKLYMSQSIEMRNPLSYQPFRAYIDEMINKKEYVRHDTTKVFLRKHYEGKLPDYITKRKDKTGWRAPIVDWYDRDFKHMFLEILSDLEKNSRHIQWKRVREHVERLDVWPGKSIHLYLSLALISKKMGLDI